MDTPAESQALEFLQDGSILQLLTYYFLFFYKTLQYILYFLIFVSVILCCFF